MTTESIEQFSDRDQMKIAIMTRDGILSRDSLNDEESILEAYLSLDEQGKRYLERSCDIWDFIDTLVGDPFKNTITFLEGTKGSGKTLSMTAIAYHIKSIYNIPIVCVGTSLGLNRETFGDFTFIDEKTFIENLAEISSISSQVSDGESAEIIESMFKERNIVIRNACLIFDEAYKLFESRRAHDKLVLAFGYFVSMSRHFGATIIIACPHRDQVEKRIRRQVDFFAMCSFDRNRGIATVKLVPESSEPIKKLRVRLDNYKHMYDTKQIVGLRKTQLNIKGL